MEHTKTMQTESIKPSQGAGRQTSVDSTEFYRSDYDDYDDDFDINQRGGGGGGKKTEKRREARGGGGGSQSIYSTKHTRLKQAQRVGKDKKWKPVSK